MKLKIAENIKTLRKAHSLTQEKLAETLSVTVGAVYKWETGLSTPEIKLIMELADLFEVSVDMLLGYEQQKNNIENVLQRMEQYVLVKDFEEAVLEAEKALTKYPNNFDIVYASASMYMLKFMEDKEESSMNKSNQLFQNAISLLYQNANNDISEATIFNSIATNYLSAGMWEKGLEILIRNNICHANSGRIGYTYAINLRQSENAGKYLYSSMTNIINNVIHTFPGLAFMYADLKDETCITAVLWLIDFFDSLKINHSDLTFLDKFKAIALAQCAVWQSSFGYTKDAEESISKAFLLATQYDASPIYDMRGVKFLSGIESNSVSFDGVGKTAMEAIDNFVFHQNTLSDETKLIKNIWEELKNEQSGTE